MSTTPDRRGFLSLAALSTAAAALFGCRNAAEAAERFPVTMSDAEWRRKLGPAAYEVLRHEDTERPFSSPLNDEHRAGTFACKGCAQPLFASKTKFDSGTGWPSFWAPLSNAVGTRSDRSMLMSRVEVHCDRCGGHLGHVFDDGPRPTGKRYCMNGVAMTFRAA
ncbi:peptide-methionine (R)-S-oxide reductase MsrB [Sphingomonas sp. KR1UV-12]|uniref:peptide-methionine (R)-S-oxide reductase n=1 Tax=Sphingomonas aurea TaxID=3063994 RepID=A0ABT9EKX3_9SPHN|nr:peptide-methionine (R)-S-oxide reductase MsrB [Sphingomonas sp. KR1UV-12]MDP1027500.1 peptide-methionine (R)-S-oxide reductase MsrB [Sphingomonas sp. KR1UV-12]